MSKNSCIPLLSGIATFKTLTLDQLVHLCSLFWASISFLIRLGLLTARGQFKPQWELADAQTDVLIQSLSCTVLMKYYTESACSRTWILFLLPSITMSLHVSWTAKSKILIFIHCWDRKAPTNMLLLISKYISGTGFE